MSPSEEQSVIIFLDAAGLPDEIYDEYDLATLEDQLIEAIEGAGVGEYDGNGFGPTEATLYMYGPDAEALFRAIEPVLRTCPLCQNARVLICPGGPEVASREVELSIR